MAIAPERPAIYEGTRIPSPIPSVLAGARRAEDVGGRPHRQLRAEPSVHARRAAAGRRPDGEDVVGLAAVVGYLHTGFEKNMEQKTLVEGDHVRAADRLRRRSRTTSSCSCWRSRSCSTSRCRRKATWMRMLLAELNRIHSHLVWLGRPRSSWVRSRCSGTASASASTILDLFELVTGARMHTRYFQAGGLAEDIPPASSPRRASSSSWMPKAVDEYETLVDRTRSGSSAPRASGCSRPTMRSRSASRARCCARRASTGTSAASSRTSPTPSSTSTSPSTRGRRLRALPRAHGGDARVDEDRRAVPRPARGHGGRAVDRRRPQGRAAAAGGAPHLDGVAHPSLQDRHRGLPRARGRGLRRRSSRRAASSAATSSRTAGRSRGA